MPQIRYTVRARQDLISLWVVIAQTNPAAADRIYDRLEARVLILGRFSKAGPSRPDIANEARMLVEAPYLFLYRLLRTACRSSGCCMARVILTPLCSMRGLYDPDCSRPPALASSRKPLRLGLEFDQ